MGALSFVRFARHVPGLRKQGELPHLEMLIEAEGQRPHAVYKILRLVVPGSIALFGGLSCLAASFSGAGAVSVTIGTISTILLAGASGVIFHLLDRTIPETTRSLRRLLEKLLMRYQSFANLTGIEPALDPEVAKLLDEAAKIYMKHRDPETGVLLARAGESGIKAARALEAGMVQLLSLTVPERPPQQKQALDAGWAVPILEEMRQLDAALDAQAKHPSSMATATDALEGLRDARIGVQNVGRALEELDDHLNA